MGGHGSGRKPDPAKQFRVEERIPISQEMFLPNVSNVQDFARKDRPDSKFTAGSVLFADANGVPTQDNTNLFWNDTDNGLHLGVRTGTLNHNLNIHGDMALLHTAAETDDHAVEISVDAAGFGDVKGIDMIYTTGAIAGGQDEEVMLVNIDESASTGGVVAGLGVLTTTEGSADVYGIIAAVGVNPILQGSGTFGDMDYVRTTTDGGAEADKLSEFISTGSNTTIFNADDDYIIIGDIATFAEIEFILATNASGGGISPTFQFSTGGSGFTTFTPIDGTNGMKNNGAVAWQLSDISGSWATNTSGNFEIKIIRTRNTLSTAPIESIVQIAAATNFSWNKSGDIVANTYNTVTGAELNTLTDGSDASSLHNHTTANLNDTTATGANLTELTDGSETTLHSHAGGGSKSKSIYSTFIKDADETGTPYDTALTGNSAATVAKSTMDMGSGTTDGNSAGTTMYWGPAAAAIQTFWDDNPEFSGSMGITSVGGAYDGLAWMGVGMSNTIPTTIEHAGFNLDMTEGAINLEASNSDGSTQTLADITFTFNEAEQNMLHWVMLSGTNIKFYVNNVLKSTSTTNLPAGAGSTSMFGMGIKNDAGETDNVTARFGQMTIQFEGET